MPSGQFVGSSECCLCQYFVRTLRFFGARPSLEMKIAWVTPFSTRSAIGRVSSAVVRELLARHHEVLIIRSERDKNDALPTYPSSVPVTWWHDISPHDLELRNDGIVLNFGDNYEFHAGTL